MGRRDETFVIARFKLSVASVILIISVSFSKNLLRFTLLLTTDQDCSMRSSSGKYDVLSYIARRMDGSIIHYNVIALHVWIPVHLVHCGLQEA